jgi:Leucine-rich repeat (LRR) protein
MSSGSTDVGLGARPPRAEQVLGNADLVGLITSMIKDEAGSTNARAAHSLCLASKSVSAAVLASVQRVRMGAPLPAVLQQMASLASLYVGPGPMDSLAQLRQLTRLRADRIGSPQALSAIMQLTRLQVLQLDIDADDCMAMRHALQGISCLGSLSSLVARYPQMKQLPNAIGQPAALSSLDLGWCRSLQQLPDTIGQLAALTSLDLCKCSSLLQLPDTIGQLSALGSLYLGECSSLQQLPDTIGQLSALSSLELGSCRALQQLPDTISSWQPSTTWT